MRPFEGPIRHLDGLMLPFVGPIRPYELTGTRDHAGIVPKIEAFLERAKVGVGGAALIFPLRGRALVSLRHDLPCQMVITPCGKVDPSDAS
jgi:hypothetical protein